MNGIKNKILPGLIPPFDDELLSSWIYRLAIEHKTKPQTFTSYYFNNYNFWSRDVDKFLPLDILKTISKITNLNINEVKQHQLSCFSNKLFEDKLTPSYTDGLTNLGIYHRKRKKFGLLACPSCLDKDQYFKKEWRLMTSLVCTKCSCHLIDKCSCCNAPIIFQRLEIGYKNKYLNKPIYQCWKCNYDLRRKVNYIKENSLILEYQNHINYLLLKGCNEKYHYSFLYLKVLLLFLRKIVTSSKTWYRIRNGLMNEYNLNSVDYFSPNMIHDTTIEFRSKNLPLIYSLLHDIENVFVPFCKKNKIRYSDFSKDDSLPFWFYEIFMKYY